MNNRLRVVVDNTTTDARYAKAMRAGREAAYRDFEQLAERAQYWRAMAVLILLTPIRFVSWICSRAYRTGQGVIIGAIRLVVGTIGLAFIGIVVFGMLHVLLYPLFR